MAGGWARSFQRRVISLSFKRGTKGDERSRFAKNVTISSNCLDYD